MSNKKFKLDHKLEPNKTSPRIHQMVDPIMDYKASLQEMSKLDFLISDISKSIKIKCIKSIYLGSRKDLQVDMENKSMPYY